MYSTDPNVPTFQEMFLGFYLPKSEAVDLARFLDTTENTTGKYYNYYVCTEGAKEYILKHFTEEFRKEHAEGEEEIQQGFIYTEFPEKLERFLPLFSTVDPMVYMTVDDPIQENRDLYVMLLKFFKSKSKK